jgi:TatD DNase family protein
MTRKELKNAKFIDIHAHKLLVQQDTVIIYSFAPGITKNLPAKQYFSAGIHPWSLNNLNLDKAWDQIQKLTQNQGLRLIGESGLDSSIDTPLSEQEILFRRHIELSERLKLPLIIHCVKEQGRILKLRKETRAEMPWIFHDYNGNKQMIQECLKADSENIFFSIGPNFIKRPTSKVAKNLRHIPQERLFFETDDQEEYCVKDIYLQYCDKTGFELNKLIDQIQQNFKRILRST